MKRSSALFPFLIALLSIIVPGTLHAQDADDDEPTPGEEPPIDSPRFPIVAGQATSAADFQGSLQVVRAPSSNGAQKGQAIEIFPEASRVWMSVRDTDPVPIERARRGGEWLCTQSSCNAQTGTTTASTQGDSILRSIKIQTPTLPLPVTIWRRIHGEGKLDFDPVLLGRRSYAHVCSYPPTVVEGSKAPKKDPTQVEICHDGTPVSPEADSAELMLGLEWPRQAELAGFRYLAIVDACGNARVQPFQRSFNVAVLEAPTSDCGRPDGRVLRVFPSGSFIRVTAFNIDGPASGDVMNVTYRVAVPPLENYSEAEPAKLLFPDFKLNDLKIDCGPSSTRRGPTDGSGRPLAPPGFPSPASGSSPYRTPPANAEPKPKKKDGDGGDGDGDGGPTAPKLEPGTASGLVGDGAGAGAGAPPSGPPAGPPVGAPGAGGSPGPAPPDATPEALARAAKATKSGAAGSANVGPYANIGRARGDGPPPMITKQPEDDGKPGPKPLDHGTLVIAPEPLTQGNCHLNLLGATRRRLVAPLALRVRLLRTDVTRGGAPIDLLTDEQGVWIAAPQDSEFPIPPLREGFDGDSRLKLIVESDPMSPDGKVVLLSDAGRVAVAMHEADLGSAERARRMIGSVTIHSVPLCGESNFERIDEAGNCIRAYLTIPAMLATLQITRAPWVEKPLITRSVLSAVGVALAFDSYDPVERRAFPVAGQVGGFVQNLGDDKIGLLAYVGVAPTLPILGDGGNTTTFGFLGGIGITYITNANGPDEGFKPTAFLSVVVQVGQANPEMSTSGRATFGTYNGE